MLARKVGLVLLWSVKVKPQYCWHYIKLRTEAFETVEIVYLSQIEVYT